MSSGKWRPFCLCLNVWMTYKTSTNKKKIVKKENNSRVSFFRKNNSCIWMGSAKKPHITPLLKHWNGRVTLLAITGTKDWYPLFELSHYNSFGDWVPVDEITQLSNMLQWPRNIVGCACTGNAGNVFPATDFKGNR